MRELPVGNGLLALVDDDVFKAVSGYEWVLSGGKPYLKEMQPTWEGSRNLHRHVLNVQDPQKWVIFRSGYTLDCRRENLFAGTPAQCKAFRRLNPQPQAEMKVSTFTGVLWDSQVQGWTVDYQAYQLSKVIPQYFSDEADAAREFDCCLHAQLDWKNSQVADFKARLAEKEQALEDFRISVASLVNFPAA